MTRYGRVLGAFGLTVLLATPAAAQPLGTFRWQTQPFCNVLVLAVTGTAAGFRMEGTDDQCGGTPASAIGMAYLKADGNVGVGLTLVFGSAVSLHIDATIIPGAGFSGSWSDSVGRGGPLFFTPAAGTGGPLRPVVAPVVAYGSTVLQPPGGGDQGLSATVSTDTGTPNDAAGLLGHFGGPMTLTSPAPAGVRGESSTRVGVLGLTDTGHGVAGGADTGVGVQGYAMDGANSIGVQAVHLNGGTALQINNGAIKVAGPVRPAFVWTVPPADHGTGCTNIDNPLTNADPDAILLVTYRSIDVQKYLTVGYRGDIQQWRACTTNGFNAGNQIGVLVIKQ